MSVLFTVTVDGSTDSIGKSCLSFVISRILSVSLNKKINFRRFVSEGASRKNFESKS